ncbi:TonB-dependent receptor [Aquimarina sp. 2201CG1-2-11]|uniref:TonB-dependent receptor plug domain-containing protein n=1 Tax=Aquimarina discodermiae TaxID=3231043 RepID=UPI003461BA5C
MSADLFNLNDFTDGTPEDIAFVNQFLQRRPDAGNINGSPATAAAKFLVNSDINIFDKTNLYFNAAYVYKSINSFANYRTPYWRTLADFPYLSDFFPATGVPNNYDGYVPTFDGILNDYNGTIGFKSNKNGWIYDLSFTVGSNLQKYTVRNSHNRNFVYSPSTWVDTNNNGIVDDGEITEGSNLYRENSPISFDSGGTRFTHKVGNIDISKILTDQISIAFGTEFRSEDYEVIPGELASYDGGGTDSFAGSRPENSGNFNRYNFGGYFDISYDVTENLLFNGTVRAETYSDFGDALVWKLSSRYKFNDKITLRGSASTGFRAPTLHQIYSQKLQYSFVAGQGIQVTGLINNVSPQAKFLEIPQLDSEKSTNFTIGLGAKITNNLNLTVDYYNIAIEDRIILSTDINGTNINDQGINIGTTPLDDILRNNNLNSASFFINGLDTRTSGIDVVIGYKNLVIGNGKLDFNLSGNYTIQNEREGNVKNPSLVESGGQSVFDLTSESSVFTSRPETKWILGVNYTINDFNFSANNTYFGKAIFKDPGLNDNLRTEFIPKIVTDLGINYAISEKFNLSININNILNVLPEWKFTAENQAGQNLINDTTLNGLGITPIQEQSNLVTFNQRYPQTTYFGYHFSQLGTLFNLSLNYKF